MTIRVLLADDQELVRAGFRMILETQADIEVAGEAGDRTEAVAATRRLQPDVVLMDIRMPNLDGLQATKQIVAAGSGSRVGILTTFDLAEYVYQTLAAGASGFLLKNAPPEQLIRAVRWSPPATLCWPVDHPPGHRAVHPPLTSRRHRCPCGAPDRERDVLS
jgi:DNA-binding NarL/FixJ family response regulator